MSAPSRDMSKPAASRARAFFSSRDLHQMNSSMSGWSTSRMTILAARRVLPPLLMVPAEASAPRMKLTGPEAVPPPLSSSLEERMRLRLMPAPEPPLKIVPSSTYQLRMESILSSTDRMKQAEACWGTPLTPMLNHTGELKAARWLMIRYLSSSEKACGLVVVDEVAVGDAPGGDGVDHAVGDLLERPLALGGADGAAEVLLGDDVGGVQRPPDRELDTELLEGDLAGLPVGDPGVTPLPLDHVVGVGAGGGEVPSDADAGLLGCQGHECPPLRVGCGVDGRVLLGPELRWCWCAELRCCSELRWANCGPGRTRWCQLGAAAPGAAARLGRCRWACWEVPATRVGDVADTRCCGWSAPHAVRATRCRRITPE